MLMLYSHGGGVSDRTEFSPHPVSVVEDFSDRCHVVVRGGSFFSNVMSDSAELIPGIKCLGLQYAEGLGWVK